MMSSRPLVPDWLIWFNCLQHPVSFAAAPPQAQHPVPFAEAPPQAQHPVPFCPLMSDWLIWLNCLLVGLLGTAAGLVLLLGAKQVLEFGR